MALVYELEVYKKSYDLLIKVFDSVKHYRREYKYNLGDKIKQEVLDAMISIYRANVSYKKKENIERAKEHIEMLKILIRLSKDIQLINIEKYTELFSCIEDISKQLSGWHKWSERI